MRLLTLLLTLLILGCQTNGSKLSVTDNTEDSADFQSVPVIDKVNANISLHHSALEFVFSEPMQRVNSKAIPITIYPQFDCSWYWTDPRHLACNFNQSNGIRPATKYRISIGKGLYSMEGVAFAPYLYEFDMARPKITNIRIEKWKSPTDPEIIADFNVGVEPKSLRKRIFLQGPNGKNIPLKLIPRESIESGRVTSPWDKYSRWILEPKAKLDSGVAYVLIQKSGISSPFGSLQSRYHKYNQEQEVINTYGYFEYFGSYCKENYKGSEIINGACIPGNLISLKFSSPLNENQTKSCEKSMDDLLVSRQNWSESDKVIALVTRFAAKKIRIKCLEDIEDIFGRKLPVQTQIHLETTDFSPSNWNNHQDEVITNRDELTVLHHSVNSEKLGVVFTDIAPDIIISKRIIELNQNRNKIFTVDLVPSKLKSKNRLSGAVDEFEKKNSRLTHFSVQKSKYNIIIQLAERELLVFISNIHTNQPIKNTNIELVVHNLDKQVTYSAVTNNSGLATIKLPTKADGYYYRHRFEVKFQNDENLTLAITMKIDLKLKVGQIILVVPPMANRFCGEEPINRFIDREKRLNT